MVAIALPSNPSLHTIVYFAPKHMAQRIGGLRQICCREIPGREIENEGDVMEWLVITSLIMRISTVIFTLNIYWIL